MEIKNLRYFLAVAREENMSHAAELLHVTQPTLSKALKALEEELGKKLFTRHSFSIKLTDEGMLLRNRAENLVAMADKIEQEFISLDDIRCTFARYTAPEEVWCMSACVDGTTACVTNASCQVTLQALRFSIGLFLSKATCPFCGGSMDFKHFMRHISDIQNRTTDL